VGRDLAVLKAEERWGSGIVKQFALDMRNAFPEAKGFSYSNVKDMKHWYLFYYKQLIKGQQVVDPNDVTGKGHQPSGLIAATEKSHQVGGLLEMPDFHIDTLAHSPKSPFFVGSTTILCALYCS
jgi:hypothetical protein